MAFSLLYAIQMVQRQASASYLIQLQTLKQTSNQCHEMWEGSVP